MALNSKIHKLQEKIFDTFIYLSYFLIILSFLGFSNIAPNFLEKIDVSSSLHIIF